MNPNARIIRRLKDELAGFRAQCVYGRLHTITTPQGPWVETEGRGRELGVI